MGLTTKFSGGKISIDNYYNRKEEISIPEKKKKIITLLVVPHYNRRVWKLRLPWRVAVFIVFLGVMIFIVGVLGLWKYTGYYQIRKTNTILVQELSGVRETLQRLSALERQLRIMAGLELTSEDKIGIGGAEEKAETLSSSGEASQKVETIKSEVQTDTQNFQETKEWLESNNNFLQRLPSIWPVKGWVTSEFGERISPFTGLKEFHQGIDIVNQIGTPVVAPADGVVKLVEKDPVYGVTLTISHGSGYTTFYAHLDRVAVKPGQKVTRGAVVAWLGNTGRTSGMHLHYEVRINDVAVNPRIYLLD